MEIKDFIEKFAEAVEIDEALEASTEFKELDDWSSLAALSVIAMVDEEYDVAIGGKDIRTAKTLEDLFNTIKAKA